MLDLLREQNQSDKFFDDKINFLLGITNSTDKKINEKNLLNFYLSSITIPNFKYEPTTKTKPEIWRYLNAANLIKLEDATNKEKLKELEIAANNNKLDKKAIFEFYRQIPFNLNNLVNAKNNYQTLNTTTQTKDTMTFHYKLDLTKTEVQILLESGITAQIMVLLCL